MCVVYASVSQRGACFEGQPAQFSKERSLWGMRLIFLCNFFTQKLKVDTSARLFNAVQ